VSMSSALPRLYTVDEVAELLHVHPQTVRGYIRDKQLGRHKVGRYDRISDDQLAEFLATRRHDPGLTAVARTPPVGGAPLDKPAPPAGPTTGGPP
jgi:excisionase family DNA binding protein